MCKPETKERLKEAKHDLRLETIDQVLNVLLLDHEAHYRELETRAVRIEKVARLLCEKNLSKAEVIVETGYPNGVVSRFIRRLVEMKVVEQIDRSHYTKGSHWDFTFSGDFI